MNKDQLGYRLRTGFSFLELQAAFVIFGIALAGLVPLATMQLKQLQKIQDKFNDHTTYYLVPSPDAWARKLGVPASITTTDSSATTYPSEAHITFQQPTDPDPGSFGGVKYRADGGWAFGDRGNGYWYGWNADATSYTRNRNSSWSKDERYDTLCHMQKYGSFTWEIAVPNGIYTVHVVSGDPSFADSVYMINVEGVLTVSGIPLLTKDTAWIEGTSIVLVTDGRLTVSNAPGSSNNKICYIDITPANPLKVVSITSLDKSLISEDVTVHVSVTNP